MSEELKAPGTVAATRTGPGRGNRLKVIVGVGAGNAIEYFDWTVYAVFAAFFSGQFFDTGNAVSDLLGGFAVFAVGFVARPFGGLVIGRIADRKGRRFAMMLAIGMAAAGSLVIGLTPTHATIGVFAAVVLVLARMVQGVAHGGELPTAQTYVVESAPQHKRGQWASLIYVSNTSGVIVGTVLGVVLTSTLSNQAMNAWGWRIPFLIGGILGVFVLWMRSRLSESTVYTDDGESPRNTEEPGMWRSFFNHRKQASQVLFYNVGGTVVYYVWGIAAPAYAIAVRDVDPTGALWAGLGANALMIVSLPLWGMVSDRIGRKPVQMGALALVAILSFPLNDFIGESAWGLFGAMAVILVIFGAVCAVMPAMMAELFPTGVHAAGVGFPYSIAVAAFGGTAPYVQTYFADHGAADLFTWYMIALVAVSLVTLVTMPETRHRDLHSN